MSEIDTLKAEVAALKEELAETAKIVKELHWWHRAKMQRLMAEASERRRQEIIAEHNAYVDSLPHTEG